MVTIDCVNPSPVCEDEVECNGSIIRENALLDFLLLGVLVVLNYFALRWCVHQLTADGQWLRNPEERDEVLREYALTKVGQLFNPYQRDSLTSNPLYRVLGWLLLIGVVFWVDRFAIHYQWPWLLGR
jgi:hypothetical protein